MGQLSLFNESSLPPIKQVSHSPESTLEERFEEFHRANPHVYQELLKRALCLRERGVRRFGIAAIFEALRYEAAMETGGDTWKLNNDYRAFYARLLMKNVVALNGFFEIREQKGVSDGENEEASANQPITV